MSDRIKGPIILCILDGWGHRDNGNDNAISKATTANWDRFQKIYPHSLLQASEHYVGLPDGQMGNSEVGHTNIGAGRVVYQDLPRIDLAISNGELAKNPILLNAIAKLKSTNKAMHLMGLVSPGGVHSHSNHLYALMDIFEGHGITTYIHAFLDGRDTPPKSAAQYIAELKDRLNNLKHVKLATIVGRFYGMDRDRRWDRIEKAYHTIVYGGGGHSANPIETINSYYHDDTTDEFMPPFAIGDYHGIEDGDGLLMFNFRADRARQLLTCFTDDSFDEFEVKKLNLSCKIGMSDYSSELSTKMETLFPSEKVEQSLGEIISKHGLKQLRIAETEKYAHITFFFNGGREVPFEGEERILIPSPRVLTYDLKPEMSAPEVTRRLIEAVQNNDFAFVVVNYANTDMVGHTGNQAATQKAVECVDECLGKLEKLILEQHGLLIITADHGNAEVMIDPVTKQPHTAHTLNLVPFVIAGLDSNAKLIDGSLADIAPTILNLMNIKAPDVMTGHNLIKK